MIYVEMLQMKNWNLALLLFTFSSASCATDKVLSVSDFASQVKVTGAARITGYARLRGEIMIFPNQRAMQRRARYPFCVSGVFSDQSTRQLAQFNGKKVTVTGELVRFDALNDEDAPLLQRKVLAGSVIPNFCFGQNVLLIHRIDKVYQ